VKYPVCSSDCKTWNIQPPHRERKRKKKRMSLLYRLPLRRFSFADIAKAFPRFNEPRGSRQRVDRRKSTGEKREEKRKSHGRSLPRVTKNTPVEYRLTTVRSTGYFVLSWKSNVFRCARCVLGTTYTNTEPLFYRPTTRLIYSGDNSTPRKHYFWPRRSQISSHRAWRVLVSKTRARLFVSARKSDKKSKSTTRKGR